MVNKRPRLRVLNFLQVLYQEYDCGTQSECEGKERLEFKKTALQLFLLLKNHLQFEIERILGAVVQ